MIDSSPEERQSRRWSYFALGLNSLIAGALLYSIIATPDPGGIWDGYVPTWLGGEGPPARELSETLDSSDKSSAEAFQKILLIRKVIHL